MNCQRFEASDKLYGIVERKFRSKEWFYAEGSNIQDEWADYLRRLGINIKHARPEDFLFAARLKNYSCADSSIVLGKDFRFIWKWSPYAYARLWFHGEVRPADLSCFLRLS